MNAQVSRIDRLMEAIERRGTSVKAVEAAAHLGDGTLRKAKAAGRDVPLDVALAAGRELDIPAAELVPEWLRAELAGEAPTDSRGLRRVPLMRLDRSPLNPRRTFDETTIRELADSIVAKGLLQNLVVRAVGGDPEADFFHVMAGERRWRALNLLLGEGRLPSELAELGIPCRVIDADDAEHLAIALLENLQRENINPMEEAEAFAQLHALDPEKFSTKAIAERIGCTRRHVQLRLQLATQLLPEARDELRGGRMTLAQARVLATLPETRQREMLPELENYTAGDLRDAARKGMFPVAIARFDIGACGLERWTDEDEAEFFVDGMAAMKLQMKAARKLAQDLRKSEKPEWVTVRDDYHFPNWCYGEGGKGIVVWVSARSGEIEIYRNRRDGSAARATPTEGSAEAKRQRAREAARSRFNAELETASRDLVKTVGEALTFQDAVALFIANYLAGYDHKLLEHWSSGRDEMVHQGGALAVLSDHVPLGHLGCGSKELAAAWPHILALGGEILDVALTRIVGRTIKMPQHGKVPNPIVFALAERHGIAVPEILSLNAKAKKADIERRADEFEANLAQSRTKVPVAAEDDGAEGDGWIDDDDGEELP